MKTLLLALLLPIMGYSQDTLKGPLKKVPQELEDASLWAGYERRGDTIIVPFDSVLSLIKGLSINYKQSTMITDIKPFLPFYLGCDFSTENSEGNLNEHTLPHVIDMCNRGKKVQLHLRPLRDITKEEESEIDMLLFMQDAHGYTRWKDFFEYPTPDDMRLSFHDCVKLCNWLRSRGFDCDDLIYEGFAIDKTKF